MIRQQELPPCPTETVLARYKLDPPLAKAEPISDTASASVITYLRSGKKLLTAAVRQE